MHQLVALVRSNRQVADRTWILTCHAPPIAESAEPGQFANIRVGEGIAPLLRRPFSISRVNGEEVEFLYAVVGAGTERLAAKRPGDGLDLIGPLGKGFCLDHEFSTAVIVAGGVGVAPFPFLTDCLRLRKKAIITFVGARSSALLAVEGLENVQAATDDGTEGFRGNVVELLASAIGPGGVAGPKIFGCGPTPMLKALQRLALGSGIPCELSLEGDMACGVGICQGCPVRRTEGAKKYALTCTEGPAFAASEITFD